MTPDGATADSQSHDRPREALLGLRALHARPAVVGAPAQDVDLVVAARTVPAARAVLGGEQAPGLRLPGEALRVAVADAERRRALGRPVAAVLLLAEPQDLALAPRGVLRARALARVAGRYVEVPVGPEAQGAGVVVAGVSDAVEHDRLALHAAVLPAPALHLVALVGGRDQVHVRLAVVELGVERDAHQAGLALREHVDLGDRLGPDLAIGYEAHPARALGHERVAVGQEGDVPRDLEAGGDHLDLGLPVGADGGLAGRRLGRRGGRCLGGRVVGRRGGPRLAGVGAAAGGQDCGAGKRKEQEESSHGQAGR